MAPAIKSKEMKNYIDAKNKVIKHLDIKPKYDHPITIKIGPTDLCNFNCPHCSEDKSAGRSHPDLFKLIEIVEPYCKSLVFSGNGEPTVHPQFLEAIAYARQLGLEVGLITNCALLKDEDIPTYGELCSWIRVSMDATDKETYSRIHGTSPLVFERVLSNIERLSWYPATIGMGFLINDKLMVDAAVRLGEQCNVDYVQFRNFHGDTTDYTDTVKGRGLYKVMTDEPLSKTCYAGLFNKVIEPNGDIVWCCHHRGEKEFIVGNVYEDPSTLKSFLEVNTEACPLTCSHKNMNKVLNLLFNEEGLPHENFI